MPSNVVIDLPHVALKLYHSNLYSSETQTSQLSPDSPSRIGAVIDQGKQNLITGDKAIKVADEHTDTEHRGIHATGINLGRGNKGRVKTGRWTRLHSRVGVDNLQNNKFNSSGTKRNFSSTFETMVVDTENDKKPKFHNGSDEHSDFLPSQLGSAEAVEQPRQEQ